MNNTEWLLCPTCGGKTRARQGMAIFVPAGSDDDQTRKREWYDGIYGYLKEIGIEEI